MKTNNTTNPLNLNTYSKSETDSLINNSKSRMDLVWSNPDPTVAFSSQNISLNLSPYDIYMLNFMYATDNTRITTKIVPKGRTAGVAAGDTTDNVLLKTMRGFIIDITGAFFDSGIDYTTSGTYQGVHNTSMIPVSIYGIKL